MLWNGRKRRGLRKPNNMPVDRKKRKPGWCQYASHCIVSTCLTLRSAPESLDVVCLLAFSMCLHQCTLELLLVRNRDLLSESVQLCIEQPAEEVIPSLALL